MKKPTKAELYHAVNRYKQRAYENGIARDKYAKDCEQLMAENERLNESRLSQVKSLVEELNELKGQVNDLSYKDHEIKALRTGIKGRDNALEKLKIELATANTNLARLTPRMRKLEERLNKRGLDHMIGEINRLEGEVTTKGQLLGEAGDRIATLEGEIDRLTRENNCNRSLAHEWQEKYQQSQAMVMELEDLCRVNSNLKDRLITKASQYREASTELHGYKEQHERDVACISELESKVKHINAVHELVCKHRDRLKKYETFFTMLKELGGNRPIVINDIKGGKDG